MGKMTVEEMARSGGQAKYKKHGKEAYAEMGKRGAVGKLKKYGPDYYRNIRRIGIQKQQLQVEDEKRNPITALKDIFQGRK